MAGEGMESAWGQSGGCLGWEWRVLGDWRVLEVVGAGMEVLGVRVEGAQGEHGGCSEQEQRVLGMSEGCSG